MKEEGREGWGEEGGVNIKCEGGGKGWRASFRSGSGSGSGNRKTIGIRIRKNDADTMDPDPQH